MKHVQIKAEYGQLHEMATAFGVRGLGTALVVIPGFYRLPGQETQWFPFHHCRRIEVDYQSGPKPPHSKGSADLCTGFILYVNRANIIILIGHRRNIIFHPIDEWWPQPMSGRSARARALSLVRYSLRRRTSVPPYHPNLYPSSPRRSILV